MKKVNRIRDIRATGIAKDDPKLIALTHGKFKPNRFGKVVVNVHAEKDEKE